MEKKKIIIGVVAIIIVLCILVSFGIMWLFNRDGLKKIFEGDNRKAGLKDDWQYKEARGVEDYSMGYKSSAISNESMVLSDASNSGSTLGFSVGGSKSIENFRENIKNNYLPISTDLTYNGLFYDYYFETGKNEGNNSNEMFYPTYSTATSKDPISGKMEYYLTVGLNSNIKESDFKRKKLNLVVVMDISGSMSSSFNSYYYDGYYKGEDSTKEKDTRSKMKIANESLNCLIDQLKPDDRLGIVLFDNSAYLAKPVNLVGETDVDKIKEHILEITPQGGTNFEAGYTQGTDLFTKEMLNDSEYENRIIVITDAMPNLGNSSKEGLTEYVKKNANDGIYTTFIGVGVDFNTEVIECLSDVKGANYYSVHNSDEFKKTMGEDFEYMITPLVFDLELKLDTKKYEILNVYGSDTKNATSGTIMKVNTLFPSRSNSNDEVKGGIVLLKVKPVAESDEVVGTLLPSTTVTVSYRDRNGELHTNEQTVEFGNFARENYDNTGIRKAIVLTRYANLMKDWILYERMHNMELYENDKRLLIAEETGIVDCPYCEPDDVRFLLGENERTSQQLKVSEEYVDTLMKFKNYLKNEIKELNDDSLKQEVDILELLVKE